MKKRYQFNQIIPNNFKYYIFISVVLFFVIGVPIGILIGKSRIPQEIKSTEIIDDNQRQSDQPYIDENGCEVLCIEECKRGDNCREAEINQGEHCGWTKTKPIIEKRFCRVCTTTCPDGQPTVIPTPF